MPSTSTSVSRRRIVGSAAWSAPVLVTATAATAAAASAAPLAAPDWGLFVQVLDTQRDNLYDTTYGTVSFEGGVPSPTGTLESPTGRAASGGGVFTPGGSMQAGEYGGAGLWISAPKNTRGEFIEGTTTLPAGTQLRLEITAVFAPGEEGYEPIIWGSGATQQKAKILTGDTPTRVGLTGAAVKPVYEAATVDGSTWKGSVLFTTAEALVADNPAVPYIQILLSQLPVYWTEHGPQSISATLTLLPAVLLATAKTGESLTAPLPQMAVTATL